MRYLFLGLIFTFFLVTGCEQKTHEDKILEAVDRYFWQFDQRNVVNCVVLNDQLRDLAVGNHLYTLAEELMDKAEDKKVKALDESYDFETRRGFHSQMVEYGDAAIELADKAELLSGQTYSVDKGDHGWMVEVETVQRGIRETKYLLLDHSYKRMDDFGADQMKEIFPYLPQLDLLE